MKKGRLNQAQIGTILRALEQGRPAAELAREHGVSLGSIYMWKAKSGIAQVSPDAARMKKLDDENKRLKVMVAELMLENQALKQQLGTLPNH